MLKFTLFILLGSFAGVESFKLFSFASMPLLSMKEKVAIITLACIGAIMSIILIYIAFTAFQ